MNKNQKMTQALAVVAVILLGGTSAYAVLVPQAEDEEQTFSGTVTGLSAYNQPKLDLKAEEVYSHDIGLGALFTITTRDAEYSNAVFVKGYLGVFMFDIFVNVESDGYISIGCVGKLIQAEEGSEIEIKHTGTSGRYSGTPNYNKGDTDVRQDYDSDEQFANFYMVGGGNMSEGVLYRSYSPLYDPQKHTRSAYVDGCAEEAGIAFEIALSYTDKKIEDIVRTLSGYCVDLCRNGDYTAPDMTYLYFQQKERLIQVLRSIIDNDGPYLVHCNAGRDRTGFVVLLLQSLCGCSAEQMAHDEAMAFSNLYHIEEGTTEFDLVVRNTYDRNMYLIANYDRIPDIFEIDWDGIDVSGMDTEQAAWSFCTGYLGLTEDEVSQIVGRLCTA